MIITLSPAATLGAVHVDYAGHEALCHVDLEVAPGVLTAITGANGAGKSTLLEVLAGVRAPSSGYVRVPTAIAYVPQRAAVSDRLPVTVRDIVTVGAWGRVGPFRRLGASGRAAVEQALSRLDLVALAGRPFATLSGGQRQRALLAQGLARGADLLLIDEPTTGLDAASAARIRAAMAAEAARGAAVVCVTHDEAVVAAADAVVRLEAGRVVG